MMPVPFSGQVYLAVGSTDMRKAISGYDHLGQKQGIVHLGCFAHVRRKFVDVVKTRKKLRGKKAGVKTLADEAFVVLAIFFEKLRKHSLKKL